MARERESMRYVARESMFLFLNIYIYINMCILFLFWKAHPVSRWTVKMVYNWLMQISPELDVVGQIFLDIPINGKTLIMADADKFLNVFESFERTDERQKYFNQFCAAKIELRQVCFLQPLLLSNTPLHETKFQQHFFVFCYFLITFLAFTVLAASFFWIVLITF